MSFGKMNVFIEIVEKTTEKDKDGFSNKTYETVAAVRAYRESRRKSEKRINSTSFTDSTDIFRFRRIPNINISTDMELTCSGKRYNITLVEDIQDRGMYVEVLARQVDTNG